MPGLITKHLDFSNNGRSNTSASGAALIAVSRRKYSTAHAGSRWHVLRVGDVVRHLTHIRESLQIEDLW
jgi:hypothetical protein